MTDIPEAALRARQMYLDRRPVAEICRQTGLSLHQVYDWLAGGPEDSGKNRLAPIPRQRVHARPVAARAALVARIMKAAERQVRDIEERQVVGGQELDSRLRNARALALLVNTLRELSSADTRTPRRRKPKDQDEHDIPRNLDDLRRELSQRLDAMAASDTAGISDEVGRQGA